MSEFPTGKTLDTLPFVTVHNLDDIASCLEEGDQAIIHRTASMDEQFSFEVMAHLKPVNNIGRLAIHGAFTYRESTDLSVIGYIQETYFANFQALPLERLGVRPTYRDNDKRSVRLDLDNSRLHVATWFDRGKATQTKVRVSTDREDGKSREVAATPVPFQRDNLKQNLIDYMRLATIVGTVLGKESDPPQIDLLEVRQLNRRTVKHHRRPRPEAPSTDIVRSTKDTPQEKEARQLDEKYEPRLPNPEATLDNVHGIDPDSRAKLEERILAFKHSGLAADWGVEASGGILLSGEPGTGKTMAAGAISNAIGGRLWQVGGSNLISKWVGDSASNVNRLFKDAIKTAELGPLVLLLDEIDSIVTQANGYNNERESALGEFKSGLAHIAAQAPNILVVATTNHVDKVDPALRRPGRFDLHVYMPKPNDHARYQILADLLNMSETHGERIFAPLVEFSPNTVLPVTEGMTGADLTAIVKRCRARKFRLHALNGDHPGPISQADLLYEIEQFRGQMSAE